MKPNQNNTALQNNSNKNNYKVWCNHIAEPSGKLCLFASYSFTGAVEEYVLNYLTEIKEAGYSIAFISTSSLQESCVKKLEELCSLIIERENIGLDFGSWQLALSMCDWGKGYEGILLANDSVFGPFFKLNPIINSMCKRFDVWGMTDNYEVDYHIQSYFLYFNEKAIKSEAWLNFWQSINVKLPKEDIIRKYEIGLSKCFLSAGFKLGSYAPIDVVIKSVDTPLKNVNSSLAYWRPLIEKFHFPFLKRELLIKPTVNKLYWSIGVYINHSNWRRVIEKETAFPVQLIDKFLEHYFRFLSLKDKKVKIRKKKLLFISHNAEIGGAQRVLLNLISWFKTNTDIPFEIIITYPTQHELLLDEFSNLGLTTRFYVLTDTEKRELQDRLSAEYIGLVFSNTSVNIEVQQFLSFLQVPQITFVHELPYVMSCFPQIAQNKLWLTENINHFIACSEAVKTHLLEEFDLSSDKVDVVYEFIQDIRPSPETELKNILETLKIPQGAFIAGMSGTFEWRKSSDLIPAIAGILCNQHRDIHIIWLGADLHSSLYQNIISDLEKMGIANRVHLLPKQENPGPYYDLFDVFLMPSREDPFPLVNIENGFRGTPVICFENSGGSPEYVNQGAGRAVPYLDLIALKDAVLYYYNNRSQLKDVAKEIAKITKSNFRTELQAPKIYNLILQYFDEQEVVPLEQPEITIMTHIFYDTTWKEIKRKLKAFDGLNTNFFFSISEDCLIKDEIIEDVHKSFSNVFVLTTSNIGKDIGGKLALIDLYLTLQMNSDYIIFLHDKQSPQTLVGESWKNNLHKIIEIKNYNKIINVFEQNADVGVIGAQEHIINEYDSNTQQFRYNNELVPQYLKKFNISIDNYEYLSGTMYWMKACILENFFKKNSPLRLRAELEAGNVLDNYGATNAHTWERMFCWIAANEGYKIYGI